MKPNAQRFVASCVLGNGHKIIITAESAEALVRYMDKPVTPDYVRTWMHVCDKGALNAADWSLRTKTYIFACAVAAKLKEETHNEN